MARRLVGEHAAEHRPARVRHRFGQTCLGELGCVDITDDDQAVISGEHAADPVQIVLSRVGDPGVDCPDAPFVAGTLLHGEPFLVFAIVPQGREFPAVAACRQMLQSEVNADFPVACWQVVGDIALERGIPAAAGVLREASGLELAAKIAGFPEMELALEVDDVRAVDFHGARDKRYPARCPLRAEASAEPGAFMPGVTRRRELTAYRLHRVAVQTEIGGGAGAQFDQVEGAGPAHGATGDPSGLRLALDLAAVVPDEVARTGMAVEAFVDRAVLDAVLVCENHCALWLVCKGTCKTFHAADIAFRFLPCIWSVSPSIDAAYSIAPH